jgi:pyruvate/2-oxoacid:ferredoxin oxidoreductase alpha subunit
MRRLDTKTEQLLKDALEKPKNSVEARLKKLEDEMMMAKYTMGNLVKLIQDYPQVKDQLDNLEYRTLGMLGTLKNMQLVSNFEELVEAEAREKKNDVFWELSNKDDENTGLRNADYETVDDASTVIITSTCQDDQEQGIFRSKIRAGTEEFGYLKDLVGKTTNDIVPITLMGKLHNITILGIRKPNASK